MNAIEQITSFLRQPSTLMAAGCIVGAGVYWLTKDAALSLASVAIIPGAVSDHTSDVLQRIENVEDALRPRPAQMVAMQASLQAAQNAANAPAAQGPTQ